MKNCMDIKCELWEEIEQNNKNPKYVFDWLNEDNLNGFIVEHGVFWIETNLSSHTPNKVYDYLIKWGKKRGLKYLYELI